MVGEIQPIPQALGADALLQAVLKAQRYNDLISMTVNDQKKLVKKILTPNLIPKIGYHSKWFENVGVDSEKNIS